MRKDTMRSITEEPLVDIGGGVFWLPAAGAKIPPEPAEEVRPMPKRLDFEVMIQRIVELSWKETA